MVLLSQTWAVSIQQSKSQVFKYLSKHTNWGDKNSSTQRDKNKIKWVWDPNSGSVSSKEESFKSIIKVCFRQLVFIFWKQSMSWISYRYIRQNVVFRKATKQKKEYFTEKIVKGGIGFLHRENNVYKNDFWKLVNFKSSRFFAVLISFKPADDFIF